MTNDTADPPVPEMPRQTSTEPVRTHGGRSSRLDADEVEVPPVPEF